MCRAATGIGERRPQAAAPIEHPTVPCHSFMTNIADSIVVARAARRVLRGRVRSPLAAQMWARSHGATDAEIEGLGIVLTATKRRMPLAGKRCSSSSAIFKSAGLSLLGTEGLGGMGGGQATHQQELFHQSGFIRGNRACSFAIEIIKAVRIPCKKAFYFQFWPLHQSWRSCRLAPKHHLS